MNTTELGDISWVRVAIACLIVAALLSALSIALRFMEERGLKLRKVFKKRKARLDISELMALDAKRRLAVVRFDDTEHLILLGTTQDVLIQSKPALETDPLEDEDL
ncbi:MAG: flagellar biosynthetic protein FliO [Alphaproteobacteria bacterium]|nr:flagellar biosynthetic protein FliO [Alphaproteobacteria bacterium]